MLRFREDRVSKIYQAYWSLANSGQDSDRKEVILRIEINEKCRIKFFFKNIKFHF